MSDKLHLAVIRFNELFEKTNGSSDPRVYSKILDITPELLEYAFTQNEHNLFQFLIRNINMNLDDIYAYPNESIRPHMFVQKYETKRFSFARLHILKHCYDLVKILNSITTYPEFKYVHMYVLTHENNIPNMLVICNSKTRLEIPPLFNRSVIKFNSNFSVFKINPSNCRTFVYNSDVCSKQNLEYAKDFKVQGLPRSLYEDPKPIIQNKTLHIDYKNYTDTFMHLKSLFNVFIYSNILYEDGTERVEFQGDLSNIRIAAHNGSILIGFDGKATHHTWRTIYTYDARFSACDYADPPTFMSRMIYTPKFNIPRL